MDLQKFNIIIRSDSPVVNAEQKLIVKDVTMMRQDVPMNYIYYPFEVMKKSASKDAAYQWDGLPLFLPQHPAHNVTADMLRLMRFGRINNVRADDEAKSLVADLEFNKKKLKFEFPDVLERIENGKPINASVGIYLDAVYEEGEIDGKYYYFRVTEIQKPDHYAILTSQLGACSTDDGCGIINEEGSMTSDLKTTLVAAVDTTVDVKMSDFVDRLLEGLKDINVQNEEAQTKVKSNSCFDKLNSRLDEVAVAIDNLGTKLEATSVDNKTSDITNELSSNKASVLKLNESINSLNASIVKYNETIEGLIAKVNDQSEEIGALRKDVALIANTKTKLVVGEQVEGKKENKHGYKIVEVK